jgi:methyl-accepting chemotaxis protein
MTPTAIARVQHSYREITRERMLAPLFYARLFERSPEARALFPVEMSRQQAHFNVALAVLVWNLDYLGALDEPLRELGARHVEYGVKREHYAEFRDTLLEVLAESAGDLWTPQLRDDWWQALTRVIAAMFEGIPGEEPHLGQADALRST